MSDETEQVEQDNSTEFETMPDREEVGLNSYNDSHDNSEDNDAGSSKE